MLDFFWTGGLLLTGVSIIARQTYVECTRFDIEDDDFGGYASRAIAGICFVIMSAAAAWDLAVRPLFAWLCRVLPEPATDAHTLTAAALTGVVAVTYVLAVPLATVLTVSQLAERRKPSVSDVAVSSTSVTYLSDVRK